MASLSIVATVSSRRLPNQKRRSFHRDFNSAARFSIVLRIARPRFTIKMHRTRRRRNFELAKFARRQGDSLLSSGQVRIDMLDEILPLMLAHSDKVQPAIVGFCFWSEM